MHTDRWHSLIRDFYTICNKVFLNSQRRIERERADLGEECVETVDLLSLFNVGVVLSDSFQSQLVHQVDGVGGAQVLVLQREGGGGGGGREGEGETKRSTRLAPERTKGTYRVHLALHLSPWINLGRDTVTRPNSRHAVIGICHPYLLLGG